MKLLYVTWHSFLSLRGFVSFMMAEDIERFTEEELEEIFNDDERPTSSRFACTTTEAMNSDLTTRISQNTRNKTKWAMKIFREWLSEWRIRCDEIPKVLKPIDEFCKDDLDYALRYFFCDVRKTNGERYPPKTLKEIACSIQHYFNNELDWNISLFVDSSFRSSRDVLDSQMKKSARMGLVKPRKRAEVISFESEDEAWKNGTFGRGNPKQLQETLLYHLGLHLSLRASQEHRNLVFGANSQIELKQDESGEYLIYTERMSKNKRFGLKHSSMEPKQTKIYSLPGNPQRCVVSLYKEYVSHRPESHGLPGHSAFYLARKPKPNDTVWYKASPLGVHSIENVTKNLFSFLRLSNKNISNSSLRRTVTNRLISAGISQDVAQKKTGRISDAANAAYVDSGSFEKQMSCAIYNEQNKKVVTNTSFEITRQQSSSNASFCPVFNNCTVTINNNYK